jgi:alcohol dehydrogenase class IV
MVPWATREDIVYMSRESGVDALFHALDALVRKIS